MYFRGYPSTPLTRRKLLQKKQVGFSTFAVKWLPGGWNWSSTLSPSPPLPVGPWPSVDAGVFGQPLMKVVDQPKPASGTSTPVPSPPTPSTVPPKIVHHPPLSPTGSEASFLDGELNPTALLLDELTHSASLPSPHTQRRMSLLPADRQVPDLVLKAIQHLDHNGVKVEGLFRISGAKSRITEVCVCVWVVPCEVRVMWEACQGTSLTLQRSCLRHVKWKAWP